MPEHSFEDQQSFLTNQVHLVEENSEVWAQRFIEWVKKHREPEMPSLSDEAIDRESIYEDDR